MTARYSHEPRRSRPHPSLRRRLTDRLDADAAVVDLPEAEMPPRDLAIHWVRVTCPECGVVRVRTDRVVVRNCVDDQTWTYRATCCECERTFLADTPESLALAAIGAGVRVETWTSPVPSARRSGPPFEASDVFELHLALLDESWFERLADAEPPLGDR